LNHYYSTNAEDNTPKKEYSETTKKLVFGLARMMGYYSTNSTAIRASHDLYNVCAQQVEDNKKFYFEGSTKSFNDSGRIVNSYVKDLLAQFHGGVVAYDEGMCKDDPVLAAALWR
jgi:cytochrome b pre-mRNA-processing protein 3